MMESPRSLTAVVHVKFNYPGNPIAKVAKSDLEVMSKVLDQAAEMSPEHQDILIKFADYLKNISESEVGAGPV